MGWRVTKIMIFSELYSAYYNAVAVILREAVKHPVTDVDIRRIAEQYAFSESMLTIPSALKEERWQLIKKDGTTVIQNNPQMPLTMLQKRWLKAISLDTRVQLFGDFGISLNDVEPLFTPEDIYVFDKYLDGDDYSSDTYRKNFKLILDAIRNKYPLSIDIMNRKGNIVHKVLMPKYLEYSEKDDKFRLIGAGNRFGGTVNLGKIISCKPYEKLLTVNEEDNLWFRKNVVFELVDERKALERVLLHFAHFEKRAERLDSNKYKITVFYNKQDEMEIVIRVLSFGPMIKVTAPQDFIELIKEKLRKQRSCEL